MATTTSQRYIGAIGRRKTSTAQVRITPSNASSFVINDKDIKAYFPTTELVRVATESLTHIADLPDYAVTVVVSGGGIHSQAEAIRHGIARALTEAHDNVRVDLKKEGFLKRDPRSKERRKFGLRKARKSAQWSKR